MSSVRNFCSPSPTMAAAYALQSCQCANHALAAAPGAFTSLQQSPALRCGSGHGSMVHPPHLSPGPGSRGMPTMQDLSAPGTSCPP